MIIGCAFEVYNALGYGFLESVYEKSMLVELNDVGLKVESQVPILVEYKGNNVGEYIADIVVDDKVIVELKSVSNIAKIHEAQLVNYLIATGKPVGLLINFGPDKVNIIRRELSHTNNMSSNMNDE